VAISAFNKFNCFVLDKHAAKHNFVGGSPHVLKLLLTNVAPVATNAVKADITEIAAGGGYAAGGNACTIVSATQTAGSFKLVVSSPAQWVGSGAGMAAFRYAVLWNSTTDALIGWWDYGSSLSLAATQTFDATMSATTGVLVEV
jgi:hypothetical protein